MKHKIFTFLLAVMASVGMSFAETYSGSCGENLTWSLNTEDGVLTISGTGAMEDYESNGTPWNPYSESIKSIVIEMGVTSIGNRAFYCCYEVISVVIPNSVTQIGEAAFYGCAITSLDIPNSVTAIASSAFRYCRALTSVSIPNSVQTISYDAFQYCDNLVTVDIPSSVTSIDGGAFAGNKRLQTIHVDEANPYYSSIDGVLFDKNQTKLIQYPIGKEDTLYTIPSTVTTIGYMSFSYISKSDNLKLTSLIIPNSVTTIGGSAFWDADNLTSITNYATSPQVINSYVFTGVDLSTNTLYVPAQSLPAYNAAEVWKEFGTILPIEGISDSCVIASGTCGAEGDNLTWKLTCDGVLTISGTGAMADYESYTATLWYSNRESIKSIVIKEGVTSIGKHAFCSLNNLTSVTIPNSVTVIGNYAFGSNVINGCSNLTAVHISDLAAWCNINFSASTSNPLNYAKNLYLNGTLVEELVIPDGITKINDYAFYNCSSLTSVTIPNSVTSIGKNAFINCKSMVSVTIPNGVTSIGSSAFVGCSSLNAVNISDLAAWCNISFSAASSNPLNYAKNLYLNGILVEKIVIPNGVTKINDYTFYNCSSLTSVTISNGVTSIGNSAFYGCSSMTAVTIPSSVTTIGSSAFGGCSSLNAVNISDLAAWCKINFSASTSNPLNYAKNLYLNGTLVKDLVIPNGVTKINDYAFYNCSSLTSVTIPNSVTSIGSSAFNKCSGLTSVTIPSSITTIESNAFNGCSSLTAVNISDLAAWCNINFSASTSNPLNYAKNLYLNGTLVEELVIPDGITKINDYAFYNCSSLTSVTIPNSVTSIGKNAFINCSSLTSVAIPNSVTTIGSNAFSGCSGLTSVTIPNSVDSIGTNAFRECTGITSLTISNSVTTIESAAFWGCTGLTSITNLATTPQAVSTYVFGNPSSNTAVDYSVCTLYVPAESVEAYKAADVWKDFGNILPIDGSEVLSIAEAIQIGMALDSMATSEETYTIEGYVINAGTFYAGAKYQNWYMADDQETTSSDFQAYKCYPIDGIDTVEVRNGSKVRMTGHLQKYYDRQKALYVVEMTYTPAIILSKPQIDTITVAEALALGAELEDNASTGKQYAIRGYVSSVSQYYEQLGDQDFYIADDPNSTANTNAAGGFYVYRGVPSTGTAVNKGDLVELTCAIRKYVPASGTNIKIENSEFPISVTVLQTASDTCIVASGTCGAEGDNLTWTLTCDSVLTISGTGAMADYGESTNKAPWVSLRFAIHSVIIENGVSRIGNFAFYYKYYFTSVTIPSSVTQIGIGAFYGCNFISLVLPNSVTTIEGSAFRYCRALTSVSIPSSVQTIGSDAFEFCDNLETVYIPSSVISIGNSAFAGNKKMRSINVDEANPNYSSIDGVLFNKNQTVLVQYPLGKKGAQYTIPNTVTTLESMSFSYFSKTLSYNGELTSIVIPNSVTMIYGSAFWASTAITSITNYAMVPQVITANDLDKSTCTLYVPAQSIEAYQAADVWKEFGTILPIEGTEESNYATLADIYNMAADSAFTLGAFDVVCVPSYQNGANMYIKDVSGSGVIYMPNYGLQAGDHVEAGLRGKVNIYGYLHEITPVSTKEELTITSGEAPAPMVATEVPSLTNVNQYVVYKGVSFSTDTAFVEGRRHLVYGTWNGQEIAFYNQYHIGATLQADKTYNITAANSLYGTTPEAYPLSVEEVSSDTPEPCVIASGTCGAEGDNLTWTLTCDSVLTISGTGAMEDYEWNKAPWYSYRKSITSVVVEDGVTSLGSFAFDYLVNVTSITLPNTVTQIGWYSIGHCYKLTSITIPASVTYISGSAFSYCEKLTAFNVDQNNSYYSSVDGVLFNKDQTQIIRYPIGKEGTHYTIPNTVIGIYDCAFASTKLESIDMPNGINKIGGWAFSDCMGLTSIVIPDQVSYIGTYAFSYCSNLESVTIPMSVTNIANGAFIDCDNLKTVTNYSTIPQRVDSACFSYFGGGYYITTSTLYVPAQSIALYQAADVWKDFGNILPIEGELPIEPTEGEFNVLYVGQDGDSISSETVMLHLPVAPVIEGFTFLKWVIVAGDLEDGIAIQAVYEADMQTGTPEVYTNPANHAQKLLRNGHVYILTDDRTYTIQGQRTK